MSFNKDTNIYSYWRAFQIRNERKINGQTGSKMKNLVILSPRSSFIEESAYAGFDGLACKQSWPEFDESLTDNEDAKIVVQINGKKRGELSLPITAEEKEAVEVAKNNNKIKNDLAGKEIKKIIYVKGRILNFVV